MSYTFDGPNKRIELSAGTTTMSVRDVWSRWVDWLALSDNAKYLPAFVTVGGDDIDPGAGTTIPIYAFMVNGWKIKPQEANHTLAVTDGILLVDGGGDPFVNTTGSYIVRINYQQPVQAISFDSGGGTVPVGPTFYLPTYATRTIGDNEGGDYTKLLALDDDKMQTGEVAATGLDLLVGVATSDTAERPSLCRVTGYYNGSSSHWIEVHAWDYVASHWDRIGTMLQRTSSFDYVFPLSTEHHNAGTGEMKIRFLHNALGGYNASHYLTLDVVAFEKISTDDSLASDIAAIRVKTDQLNFSFADVLATLGEEKDDIAAAVWSKVLIGSTVTATQLMAVISAALAGRLSGAGSSLVKIRDLEDTKDIIAAAVDSDGNRLTVTLDL